MKFFRKPTGAKFGMVLKLTVSYSFLLLLVLFISIYFYHVSKSDLQNSLETRTKTQLSYAADTVEGNLSAMYGFALSFAHNQTVSALARTSPDPPDDFFLNSFRMQQNLTSFVSVERLMPITTYFIYFAKSDYVLSTSSFSKMELFYKRQNLRPENFGQWQDTLSNSKNYSNFIPLSKYNTSNENYLYLLPLDNYLFYRIPALLGFIIDKEKIEQHFTVLFSQDGGYLYVADANGTGQFSIGGVPCEDFRPETLASLSYRNNIASACFSGKESTIARYVSDNNKWQYYYVIPSGALEDSFRPYQSMYLVVTGTGLLACFLLIYFLSKRNTRPFVRMGSQLESSLSHTQQLESTLAKQQPIIRNSYIRNIMLNQISAADEMDYAKKYLGLTQTDVVYYVLYIVAYPNGQQEETENSECEPASEEQALLSGPAYDAAVDYHLKEYFGEPLYQFSPKKHNYAIILRENGEVTYEWLVEKASSTFASFHEKMLSSHGIWTMAGMGNRNHLLENTWKSYQQAMESASYTCGDHFFRVYNSLDLSSDIYYFPVQLSESLAGFITAGNKIQVEEIFKFINKENLEKRSLSYLKMQSLLISIYDTLCRVRCTISDEDATEDQVQSIDIRLAEYLSLKQLEDAAIGLCSLFKGKTSQKQMILSMIAYIRENFRDSSLCLTKLSDKFRLSESYISYLFKENTGSNFSMYLEQIRMKKAHKLVTESTVPLSDLYLEVGYNNSNSFRRVFKKTFGVSAKAMRDSLKSDGS